MAAGRAGQGASAAGNHAVQHARDPARAEHGEREARVQSRAPAADRRELSGGCFFFVKMFNVSPCFYKDLTVSERAINIRFPERGPINFSTRPRRN